MTDRELLSAAALLTAANLAGALVAIRHDVVGEPLGLRLPGSVTTHVAAGLGSALSAPTPFPVLALAAAAKADGRTAWPGRTFITLGVLCIGGVLSEPVTWGRRSRAPAVRLSVGVGLMSAATMIRAGTRYLEAAQPGGDAAREASVV